MSLPKVQELRSRVQAKVAEVRTRARARGLAGQQMRIGGGALIEQARRKADIAARRLEVRRGKGIIPMVKEFRPGERIRRFFPQVTDRGDMSVMDEGAYPADGRGISIMPE